MKPQEMWNAYKQINPSIGDEIDAWAFGVEADLLADLVLKGEKTATASAYDLYAVDNDPLPQEGTFDVVLDSQDQAVCIVEVTKVSVQPFHQVSEDHAYKEGEGDKSLAYWRQVHEEVFTEWMSEAGLTFTPDSKVVLEEFRKVYPLQNTLSFLESFLIWILIWHSIYSTNLIESLNKEIKRQTKKKVLFPNEEALERYLVTLFEDYNFKQNQRIHKGFGQCADTLESLFD